MIELLFFKFLYGFPPIQRNDSNKLLRYLNCIHTPSVVKKPLLSNDGLKHCERQGFIHPTHISSCKSGFTRKNVNAETRNNSKSRFPSLLTLGIYNFTN